MYKNSDTSVDVAANISLAPDQSVNRSSSQGGGQLPTPPKIRTTIYLTTVTKYFLSAWLPTPGPVTTCFLSERLLTSGPSLRPPENRPPAPTRMRTARTTALSPRTARSELACPRAISFRTWAPRDDSWMRLYPSYLSRLRRDFPSRNALFGGHLNAERECPYAPASPPDSSGAVSGP